MQDGTETVGPPSRCREEPFKSLSVT